MEEHSSNENRARFVRFFTSCFCVALGLIIIVGTAERQEISPTTPGLVYVAFLFSSAIIVTLITKRLFDQHKLLSFRFDIANLILVTSLVAIPLATSNFFWMYFEPNNLDRMREIEPAIRIVTTLGLLFLMFPILIIVEAVLAWLPKPVDKDKK